MLYVRPSIERVHQFTVSYYLGFVPRSVGTRLALLQGWLLYVGFVRLANVPDLVRWVTIHDDIIYQQDIACDPFINCTLQLIPTSSLTRIPTAVNFIFTIICSLTLCGETNFFHFVHIIIHYPKNRWLRY